jgi:hypothetical protein
MQEKKNINNRQTDGTQLTMDGGNLSFPMNRSNRGGEPISQPGRKAQALE